MAADPSPTTPALPDGIALADVLALAERHAPLVRFHASEKHFPMEPDRYRRISRFRESRPFPSPDRGWREPGGFETSDRWGAGYEGLPWDPILAESRRPYPAGAFDPPRARNRRPRDGNNREGGTRGIFLQRRAVADGEFAPVARPRRIDAPAFLDVRLQAGARHRYVMVLYWFWYELNWWHAFYTHQGDWEHVTWIWDLETFEQGGAPGWAFFAQHNGGDARDWEKLHFADSGHVQPVIFVNPAGHPCQPEAEGPHPHSWKSGRDLRWLAEQPWRDFAGAWGEVGESVHTTGPLGPAFKRDGDAVRIRIEAGRRYAAVPKWWQR